MRGNGFDIDGAARLLQCARGRNIIGGDVVCLMPGKDRPNRIASLVAASLMFEMIALIADCLVARQGLPPGRVLARPPRRMEFEHGIDRLADGR